MFDRREPPSFVVDASVACAAKSDSPSSTAVRCADVLQVIFECGHYAVFSKTLSDEWLDHQSGFSAAWYAAMLQNGRVLFSKRQLPQLRERLIEVSPDRLQEIDEDFHLLEAALDYGRTVLSRDVRSHKLFSISARTVEDIRDILWQDPDTEQNLTDWIEGNAPFEHSRSLYHKGCELMGNAPQ